MRGGGSRDVRDGMRGDKAGVVESWGDCRAVVVEMGRRGGRAVLIKRGDRVGVVEMGKESRGAAVVEYGGWEG